MLNCNSFCVWQAIRIVVTAVLGFTVVGLSFGAGYMYHHAYCGAVANGCPPAVPRPVVTQPPSMAPTPTPAPMPAPFPARPRPLAAAPPPAAAMAATPKAS